MASSFHYALFAFLLFAGSLCDAADYNILDFEIARKHELWMANYGRAYKDDAEKARRFEIYKENIKYIEDFNSGGDHKYTLGEGPFTDLTNEEFLATYTSKLKVSESEIEESHNPSESEIMQPTNYISPPPSSKNWTAEGAVTYVKWQKNCGACWAFTAAAAVESLIKIKNKASYNLSPQQLIDCDTSNKGCISGWYDKAFVYIKNHKGITTELNYPFKGVKGTCDVVNASKTVATISGHVAVKSKSESALMAAVAEQPVAVVIEASKSFKDYKNGIFHGPCGTATTHTVLVVGYGGTGPNKYWILKNSWGINWGEYGYMRMAKDIAAPEGLCGIAFKPVYPKI